MTFIRSSQTWWRRLELNQQCARAADLQSTGVTNFPTPPKFVNTLRYAFRPLQRRNEECVLKHTDNACYAVPDYEFGRPFQYALIRCNFSSHKRDSILQAARSSMF